MRRSLPTLSVLALLAACSSNAPDTGGDAGDAGEALDAEGDGPVVTPQTEACTGSATACLSGRAAPSGFTVAPKRMKANLYREYPGVGTASPLATVPIAVDGTWAFSGLLPWGHYFVEVLADFGQTVSIGAVVGPLSTPSTGAPVVVKVQPVQLSVLQEAQAGGAQQLVNALAYVFDPTSGAPVQNATVTIVVGGTPQPMAWTQVAGGAYGYVLQAASGTAAQASYAISTSLPGAAISTWNLAAPAATLSPTLSSPVNGAAVPAGQPLVVAWPAQPADVELVELYTQGTAGSWTSAYQVSADADATQQSMPGAVVTAGPLLVNVEFLLGGCPSTSDGCVAAAVVAASQVTAQ
jgi:hypothetical protein